MIALPACQSPPAVDVHRPSAQQARAWQERSAVLLVLKPSERLPTDLGSIVLRQAREYPMVLDVASAVPIARDGYFLTASHVLPDESQARLALRLSGQSDWHFARCVWRDARADLLLLHVPIRIAKPFEWTPANEWLPVHTPVVHLGLPDARPRPSGHLLNELKPESPWLGVRRFFTTAELMPGDSGGAVIDAHGRLVGVNLAVRYRMPGRVFLDTEAVRPKLKEVDLAVLNDRRRQVKAR